MSLRVASLPRVVEAVERATARATDANEVLEAVATEIHAAVPHDGAMWFGTDPTTLLAVAPARMEHLDEGYCSSFWHGEFHDQDTNLFADLARSPSPAATLRAATGDRPNRSARYRDFVQPQGWDDELRVVFECFDVGWAHDVEVAPVERRDGGEAEAFRDRDDGSSVVRGGGWRRGCPRCRRSIRRGSGPTRDRRRP
jgi:hypothetical protein